MTSQYQVLGRYGRKVDKRVYFVPDTKTARKYAHQDGADEVYRIQQVKTDWLVSKMKGRGEYALLFLKAVNFQVEAGIPAVEAIKVAIESESDLTRRAKLQGAIDAIARGATLAEAMFATGLYDETIYSILMSGERIGSTSALKYSMSYLEERKTAWKAYTVVLSWLGMEVSSALSIPPTISDFAIPYIRGHLPKGTPEQVADYSHQLDVIQFNNEVWMWLSVVLLSAAAGLAVLWLADPKIKDWIAYRILMKIPLVKDWYANDALARSSKVFSTMLYAGVSMPDAVSTILKSAKNSVAKKFWSVTLQSLNAGVQAGLAFSNAGILRKDEILVLMASRGNQQFAKSFAAIADDRKSRKEVLGSRILKMSLIIMVIYIAITLLIGFKLFGLFSAGMDMSMDAAAQGI